MLAVENLGKRFDRRWVFRGLSFTVNPGMRLVVRGRNGAGKSTLLRTLAGLLLPTEGVVTPPDGDARQTVGYGALEQALYAPLTVREHLDFFARLRSCEPRTDELLDQIGLGYAGDFPARSLSTGMKARLKLAIAIQARPILLLLDEPGAGLDAAGRELVEAILDAHKGPLVLATNDEAERRFATHELELAG